VSTQALPASLQRGEEAEIMVIGENLGDTRTLPSSTVTLTDRLPEGVEAISVSGESKEEGQNGAVCEIRPGEAREVLCTVIGQVGAFKDFVVKIEVAVSESAQAGVNTASISGGGAASASRSSAIAVGGEPRFGIEHYEMLPENADGSIDTQAGSHPFQLTTDIALNQTANAAKPPAAVKDLHVKLPPGLIGNPTPFPQCPLAKFTERGAGATDFCPDDTVVGVASITIYVNALNGQGKEDLVTKPVPLFNLVPSTGEPARFGFFYQDDPVYLDTSVRSGSDYGVTVTVPSITELANTLSSRVTFWGVPGDPRHDPVRGWNCLLPEAAEVAAKHKGEAFIPCAVTGQAALPPLLALPTACEGPLQTSVEGDSWEDEGAFALSDSPTRSTAATSCRSIRASRRRRTGPRGAHRRG
jgi:hypothetical protein